MNPVEVPEMELLKYYNRDGFCYVYSDKVAISRSYSNSNSDELLLKIDADIDTWYGQRYASECVLSGEFENFVRNDYEIIILMSDLYYVLNIEQYEVPTLDDDDTEKVEYELNEYNENEFKELYLNWESFDWEQGFVAG